MLTSFATSVSSEFPSALRRESHVAQLLYDHHDSPSKSSRTLLHHQQHNLKHDIELQPRFNPKYRGEKIRINVSGRIFESYKNTLTSREGSIFRLRGIVKYYDNEKKEYFFEQDPRAFEAILTYLQCGILVRPETVALKNFVAELQFYGFGKKAWELYQSEDVYSPDTNEHKPRSEIGTALYIYNLMEHPDVNIVSRVFVTFSCLIIFLSIIVYCLETLPIMKSKQQTLFVLEAFCVAWFTLELVTRFILSPNKFQFVKSFMNIIDLVSILPFYLEFVLASLEKNNNDYVEIAILQVFRVARVFRIFKLSRYSKAILLLIVTVKSSIRELLLLLMFIIIVMILFAAAIYYFENNLLDPKNKFRSIPHTFWLVVVTITTVGYGDMVPDTLGGKLITSVLSVTGVVVVALPIPIIVNNFARFYERIMSKQSTGYQFEFDETKSNHLKDDEVSPPSIVVTHHEVSM